MYTSFAPLGRFTYWFAVLCDQSFLIREAVSEPIPVPYHSSHDCPSSVHVSPSSVCLVPARARIGLSRLIGLSLDPIDHSEADRPVMHP